jgi:hypothetical protein
MAKRLSYEEKKNQSVIDLINEMFKIAGHDVKYDDIKSREDDWYAQWTMTEEQYCEWKKFGVNYLRKSLKLSKESAEKEMAWFGLMYGLKFDNPEFKLNC